MISLEWVSDFLDIKDEDLKELAVKITKAGINVEKVITNHINNLVIGEVVSCIPHPDSDHLHICEVDVGDKKVQIVCGASNVREGIKVIVALDGAVLPGDFLIKKGKIRGVESNGMICALFELGIEEKTEENYNKGIAELPSNLENGSDANIYLGTNDTMYELDIHKHRNNDCYYHIGFAYEIACILNKKVKLPDTSYNEVKESVNDIVKLEVDTPNCPYYSTKIVKNVTIKESPDFIKRRLINAGMRPINNVVDISNYVMLEFGQPLHFFDLDKLGTNILVRQAKENEKIKTLDGVDRVLTNQDIVITDGLNPVCVAGVMGGESTDVDSNTKNILIESAIFDPVSIRYTASRLNLRSEASIRYGKGLNFEYTSMALDRACNLLEKYADATILSGKVLYDKTDKTLKEVTFKTQEVSTLLGLDLTPEDVKTELNRLDFEYTYDNEIFKVTIPRRRLDIESNVNDIAEEIGRLYGYQNLVSTLPTVKTRRGVYVGDVGIRKSISKRLRTLGLNETKTYTLTSPDMASLFRYEEKEPITLPNPMSIDKSIIRTSILPSLINVYDYNKARKVNDILLYEISKTYDKEYKEDLKVSMLISGNYITNTWQGNSIKCDFYVLKGIVDNLLDYLGFKNRYTYTKSKLPDLHPGVSAKIMLDREEIGIIGRVHPGLIKEEVYVCELSMTKLYNKQTKPLKYKETSKYPTIQKDVAFIVKKDVESDTIKNQIRKSGGRLLTNIDVFDVYVGDKIESDEKSIAYTLKFEDQTRTLTEEEVMEAFNKIITEVEKNIGAKVRNGE